MTNLRTRVKLELDSGNCALQMNFHCDSAQTTYDITDLHGRNVRSGEVTVNQTSIDLSGLKKKKYVVLILDGNRIYIQDFEVS